MKNDVDYYIETVKTFTKKGIIDSEQEKHCISSLSDEPEKQKLLSKIVYSIVAFLGGICIGGSLLLLITTQVSSIKPESLFFLSYLIYLVPAIIFYRLHKHELGVTFFHMASIIASFFVIIIINDSMSKAVPFVCIWLLPVIAGFFIIHTISTRIILVISIQYVVAALLTNSMDSRDYLFYIFFILLVLNGLFFLTGLFIRNELGIFIQKITFFFMLLYFFSMTFFNEYEFSTIWYPVLNILFFIIPVIGVLIFTRYSMKYYQTISLVFWVLFLFYKYYDLTWKLLHKSLFLVLTGILFVITGSCIAIFKGVYKDE
ncbi:MAG: hypothetical protein A2015_12630 [Spirochaetes bacterium GWF1_31_7]|nr:MAG: hypothetical protein A2Y30_12380 [Spirochaetes bacterium GWE1_32_154]OHD49623.1 MAG: hypothetical protein A2015_12630 [Spirochaetes bacterium GWF1_31_7]HBD93735.1 hypothetical protein [Spirochaetia bacterium]